MDVLRDSSRKVSIVHNRGPRGFGANHNQVMRPIVQDHAARYCLVLNNDTEPGRESIAQLVRYADQHQTLASVGPQLLNSDGSPQPSSYKFPTAAGTALFDFRSPWNPLRCPRGEGNHTWLGGACLLLRAEALRLVGYFDTRFFMFYEDTDLAKRFWQSGWEIGICPDSKVTHHGHRTVMRSELVFSMECQMRRSWYLYSRKHFGTLTANAGALASRSSLLMRSVKPSVLGHLRDDNSERLRAKLLRDIGGYDPRDVLPHEQVFV